MRNIVIAGHSHTIALLLNAGPVAAPQEGALFPITERVYGLHGAWPRTPGYWGALARLASDNSIALFWRGNDHFASFVFEQSPKFDFVVRTAEDAEIDENAVIVPAALVRAKLKKLGFGPELDGVLSSLKGQGNNRIALVGTPPPKGDSNYLRRFVENEYKFELEQLGFTPETARLTSLHVLLKLWLLLQEMYKEAAEKHGIRFIPVPDRVKDDAGFLRRKFWGEDVTHANPAYGRVMLDHLAESL